ncbi:uncharacterized protein LOC127079174 [Lathyrus oleraceus]|uniref:uncharacterized protein LOC127079174 n=1 Tax=Pisum sativum TaxID=3888 RepID=UPI0021D05F91|nr:uncharacterized protein LOC127079174 [Pisum sativum]
MLPGPIPYSNESVVPWHYGSYVYYHGMKREGRLSEDKPSEDASLNVENFAGTGRITRSVPGTSSSQEVEELLRLIRKSDYKVIDHLSQTPSKILILSLLICFEAHRNALIKLLSSAFVPQNIIVNQLERVVASISADNGLGFTDFDLPPEGRNHNKVMHISMECKGTTLSHVLVDTGSSLNVLPKSALMKIDYAGVELRPSDLIVRAFDGSRRSIFGEVDLPVKIGPQVFGTTFFFMDIQPAYCCLLGCLWIHGEGAIISTLRQKMKFLIGSKIVTVCGEEKYMVSHLTSFRYIEFEREVHETSFQAFEEVQMIKTPLSEGKKPEVSMSLLKDARVVVENGHPKGWGRLLDLPLKFDKLGLGFSYSQQGLSPEAPKAPGVLTLVKFTSVGFISNDQANTVGDDDDIDYDIDNWIRPSVPGERLCNWTIEHVIQVTLNQE